jgi:CheY-like chemotaxis protein
MIHLLVVDDEDLNLRIIEESLEDSGFLLTKARSGSEAIEILSKVTHGFEAIVLDRLMPDMDGIDVFRFIKGQQRWKTVPVIFQTALGSNKDVLEGLEEGAFYYLTKPYSKKILVSIIHLAVENFTRLRSANEALSHSQDALNFFQKGEFWIRSLEDVLKFAPVISNAFPDPSRVLTGILELASNAVEHGNLEIGFERKKKLIEENKYWEELEKRMMDPKNKDKVVSVFYERKEDSIHIHFKDQGSGFDPEPYLQIERMRESLFMSSGRGLIIAKKTCFDEIYFHGDGSHVEAVIYL